MGIAAAGRPSAAASAATLRFVPQADLSSIDPVWSTASVTANHGMMVYDSLYGLDEQLTPQPQMVAGHDISSDQLVWTFTLRDGLLFHDGAPVRPADCIASLRRWGRRRGFGQKLLSLSDDMAALDGRRFRIRLKTPFPLMTFALGGPEICMIMPQRVAETDPFKQINDATGSGPYRYLAAERVFGSSVAYARFEQYVPRSEPPSYWSGGKVAHFDRVEWVVIPDQATATGALQRGEVDWLERPSFDLLQSLRAQRDIRVEASDPLFSPSLLVLNHTQPPFDNVLLRRAILPVIDQAEFMAAVAGDAPELIDTATGVFTPHTAMANDAGLEVLTARRDPVLARKLVAESGYKGEKIILMSASDQEVLAQMAAVAQSTLASIGLNVELQTMDWGTLVSRRASDKPAAAGGWNAFCTSWPGLPLSNPGSHLPLRGNGKDGYFGWPRSPVIEALRERWFEASDTAAQAALCRTMQQVALQEVSYVPIGSYKLPSALRRDLIDVVHGGSTCFWGVRRK